MLIDTELLDGEFLKSPPPLLRLVSQAVSSSDFEALIRVHAFLDVRFRHGAFVLSSLLASGEASCTSPIVNTNRQEAVNCSGDLDRAA